MHNSLPKKWRTRFWVGFAVLLADMLALIAGTSLGGGVILVLACVLVLLAVTVLTVACSFHLRCPVCGREVSRMALREDTFFCPQCGERIHME